MAASMFCALALVSAFVCAFFAGRGACMGVQRALAASGDASGEAMPSSQPAWFANLPEELRRFVLRTCDVARYYLRNGVSSCDFAVRMVMKMPNFASMFNDASRLAARSGLRATPESLASCVCAGSGVVAIATLVALKSPVAALLVLPLGLLLFGVLLARGIENERETLRQQVPDALRCMEACMHAGLSLPQTFYEVAQQVDQPAKRVFQAVTRDLDMGYSVTVALERFRSVAALPELAFVAMALDVQYASGGSAGPILRSAEESVSRDLDLRRSLRVQTAQAKLSAQIVSIMPFALAFLLTAVDPGFLPPFFESSMGLCVLVIAVCMQATGVLLVRRMLALEI